MLFDDIEKGMIFENRKLRIRIVIIIRIWWQPYQQSFGTSQFYYRCYLPVLAGFTEYNCEATSGATIAKPSIEFFNQVASLCSLFSHLERSIDYFLNDLKDLNNETLLQV